MTKLTTLDQLKMLATRAAAENAELSKQISDLQYEPITISSFTNDIGTAEMGSTVNDVTLQWSVSKTPTALTLDDDKIGVGLATLQLKEQNITANKTWTLTATDERGAAASRTTGITFYNGVYFGISEAPETIGSAFVLGLTKLLTSSRVRNITVDAGEGQYIWYCIPKRLGECTFRAGGFEGGFDLVDTIDFTNASGYTEAYYIYRSANAGLGNTTVEVT